MPPFAVLGLLALLSLLAGPLLVYGLIRWARRNADQPTLPTSRSGYWGNRQHELIALRKDRQFRLIDDAEFRRRQAKILSAGSDSGAAVPERSEGGSLGPELAMSDLEERKRRLGALRRLLLEGDLSGRDYLAARYEILGSVVPDPRSEAARTGYWAERQGLMRALDWERRAGLISRDEFTALQSRILQPL